MENDTKVDKIDYQKYAELLANIVGITVTVKARGWDTKRQLLREYYVSKGISAVELEIEPVRYVTVKFTDGTHMDFFNLAQFDDMIGKFGDYGSIWEYLFKSGFMTFFD
jgi:hypothetical protein